MAERFPLSVSLFVPAYNAERWLTSTLRRIPADFLSHRIARIHVINDGSSDRTGAEAEKLAADNARIAVHHFANNRGYGAVVRFGLERCLEDETGVAICLHGDGQYAPELLPQICAPIDRGDMDLVQGSRHASGSARRGGMPVYKIAAGKILTALENRVFGLRMSDFHSGYLAYRVEMLRALPFHALEGDFEVDLELIALARARGYRVGEIAIPTRYAGEISHLNPWVYGLRVLGVLRRYRRGFYHRLGERDA